MTWRDRHLYLLGGALMLVGVVGFVTLWLYNGLP
jgi:hypothetical protein